MDAPETLDVDTAIETLTQTARLIRVPLPAGLEKGLDPMGAEEKLDALVRHTPAIHTAWAAAVGWASATIAKIRRDIPGIDLTGATPAGLEQHHIGMWIDAMEAIDRVDVIARAWAALGAATDLLAVGPDEQPLIVADLDVDAFDILRTKTVRATAAAGHPLSLATFDQWRERVTSLREEREQLQLIDAREKSHGLRL